MLPPGEEGELLESCLHCTLLWASPVTLTLSYQTGFGLISWGLGTPHIVLILTSLLCNLEPAPATPTCLVKLLLLCFSTAGHRRVKGEGVYALEAHGGVSVSVSLVLLPLPHSPRSKKPCSPHLPCIPKRTPHSLPGQVGSCFSGLS